MVAVEEELQAIRKKMLLAERKSASGITFFVGSFQGKSVALAKSGMGAQRAFAATRRLIEQTHPDRLIIAGFCAGLTLSVQPGDLVVPTTLATLGGYRGSEMLKPVIAFGTAPGGLLRPPLPNSELLCLSRRMEPPGCDIHFGALLTVPAILAKASQKREIAHGSSALAADMESRGAVAAANAAGVPWLVVRAVTDGMDDDLPFEFERFVDETGEVKRGRLAMHVAMRPWLAPAMIRLGARSARAATNLASFVEQFVSQ